MSVGHYLTSIEFFGGPCDGHRHVVSGPIEDLELTTIIPMPFMAERSWLRPTWMFRATREAIYALDRGSGQYGYRYLGTIRREKPKSRSYCRWLPRWLKEAFARHNCILGKSRLAA